jgi:hypothetical protein
MFGGEVVRVAERFAPCLHRQAGCDGAAERVAQAG